MPSVGQLVTGAICHRVGYLCHLLVSWLLVPHCHLSSIWLLMPSVGQLVTSAICHRVGYLSHLLVSWLLVPSVIDLVTYAICWSVGYWCHLSSSWLLKPSVGQLVTSAICHRFGYLCHLLVSWLLVPSVIELVTYAICWSVGYWCHLSSSWWLKPSVSLSWLIMHTICKLDGVLVKSIMICQFVDNMDFYSDQDIVCYDARLWFCVCLVSLMTVASVSAAVFVMCTCFGRVLIGWRGPNVIVQSR